MAITLDGTNGIGVGATPSDAKIEAREDSSTSYPSLLKLTNGQNYGYGARMEFAQPLTNGGGIVTSAQIDSGYDGTGKGNLNFRTVDNGSSLQAMSIDSAGRVTMPYQPAFRAQGSSETWYTGTGVVPFNNAVMNHGGHYNNSTHAFTAPVAGVYHFSWSMLARANTNEGHMSIRINGVDQYEIGHFQVSSDSYEYIGGGVDFYLNANDVVDIRIGTSFDGIYMGTNQGRYSMWSGFLLG